MRTVDQCPGCGEAAREIVCEYNGLMLLASMRESPLCRYDYALCHGCGLVYASRRPEGDELQYLYSRFDEVLGRTEDDESMGRTTEIGPDERAGIAARIARGWLVSEERDEPGLPWLDDVFEERVLNSFHVNLVSALLPVSGTRVLELRATTGFMLDTLKRGYGAAEIYAMPMSERHALVIEGLNPMPMAIIDFDRLEIPFEGRFDLILARHMVTHALEPARLWRMLAERLTPGGHVYLFLENDDSAMLRDKRKNLFGEQKCFHFQNFDLPTLAGVLRFNGLDPVFIRHPRPGRSEMVCLAQRNDAVRGTRIAPDRLEARRELYRRWRDLSVMSLPPELQPVFADEINQIRQRALAAGYAVTDRAGRIVPRKALRLMHAEGYARLNEQAGGR